MTVIGTVLPFSTSGGMSSLTLPVRTAGAAGDGLDRRRKHCGRRLRGTNSHDGERAENGRATGEAEELAA